MSESESESESGESVGWRCRPPRAFEPFPDNGGWFNLRWNKKRKEITIKVEKRMFNWIAMHEENRWRHESSPEGCNLDETLLALTHTPANQPLFLELFVQLISYCLINCGPVDRKGNLRLLAEMMRHLLRSSAEKMICCEAFANEGGKSVSLNPFGLSVCAHCLAISAYNSISYPLLATRNPWWLNYTCGGQINATWSYLMQKNPRPERREQTASI